MYPALVLVASMYLLKLDLTDVRTRQSLDGLPGFQLNSTMGITVGPGPQGLKQFTDQ